MMNPSFAVQRRNKDYDVVDSRDAGYSSSDLVAMHNDAAFGIAEIASFKDSLRADLARQTLVNQAGLAQLENNCNELAPNGREEYRRIVQAYNYKAVKQLLSDEL